MTRRAADFDHVAEYHAELAESRREADDAAALAATYCCADCDGPREFYGYSDAPWWAMI